MLSPTRIYLCALTVLFAIACGDDDGNGTGTDSGARDATTNGDGGQNNEGGNPNCSPMPSGTERETGALCGDGIDNDCDGFLDCMDNDCRGAAGFCPGLDGADCTSVTAGDENAEGVCGDGCDNDGDGYIDCRDNDCFAPGAGCQAEGAAATCVDGIDNDNDSFLDCDDRGCEDNIVCVFETTNAKCSDGEDNDGDDDVDCADSDCQGQHIVVCDGDQVADPLPQEADWAEASKTKCTDGSANGGEYIDCNDFGCHRVPGACDDFQLEGGREMCSDGEDNDGDGLTDCEDTGCTHGDNIPNMETVACGPSADKTPDALCMDGTDNDENDFSDCDDNGCEYDPDVTVCGMSENSNELCSDGLDNDGDGFIDCNDRSCGRNRYVTVCESGPGKCSDGVDNDGDGDPDCLDDGCEFSEVCRTIEGGGADGGMPDAG